jgi:hypothetical protein
MNIIQQDETDIVFVQEPYLLQNKTTGITRTYRICISYEEKSHATIIIANDNMDAVIIKQLCNRDNAILKLRYKSTRILTASMYLDINEGIDNKMTEIDEILQHSKGSGILIAMDSNSRSMVWHDNLTNSRGKKLQEYLISRDLHIMNEESKFTTFQSCRGSRNIELTIINNWLLKNLSDQEISEGDSFSDHSIIKFKIGRETNHEIQHNHIGPRYIINEQNCERFDKNLKEIVAKKFRM